MDRQTLQSKQQQQQQQPKQQPSLQTASQPQHLNISLGSAGHAPYGHRHHPYQQANQLGTASAAPAEPFKVDQQTFEKSLNEVYQFKQCISVKIKQLESSITRLKSLVFVPAESSASETSAASSSSISTEHSSMAGDQRSSPSASPSSSSASSKPLPQINGEVSPGAATAASQADLLELRTILNDIDQHLAVLKDVEERHAHICESYSQEIRARDETLNNKSGQIAALSQELAQQQAKINQLTFQNKKLEYEINMVRNTALGSKLLTESGSNVATAANSTGNSGTSTPLITELPENETADVHYTIELEAKKEKFAEAGKLSDEEKKKTTFAEPTTAAASAAAAEKPPTNSIIANRNYEEMYFKLLDQYHQGVNLPAKRNEFKLKESVNVLSQAEKESVSNGARKVVDVEEGLHKATLVNVGSVPKQKERKTAKEIIKTATATIDELEDEQELADEGNTKSPLMRDVEKAESSSKPAKKVSIDKAAPKVSRFAEATTSNYAEEPPASELNSIKEEETEEEEIIIDEGEKQALMANLEKSKKFLQEHKLVDKTISSEISSGLGEGNELVRTSKSVYEHFSQMQRDLEKLVRSEERYRFRCQQLELELASVKEAKEDDEYKLSEATYELDILKHNYDLEMESFGSAVTERESLIEKLQQKVEALKRKYMTLDERLQESINKEVGYKSAIEEAEGRVRYEQLQRQTVIDARVNELELQLADADSQYEARTAQLQQELAERTAKEEELLGRIGQLEESLQALVLASSSNGASGSGLGGNGSGNGSGNGGLDSGLVSVEDEFAYYKNRIDALLKEVDNEKAIRGTLLEKHEDELKAKDKLAEQLKEQLRKEKELFIREKSDFDTKLRKLAAKFKVKEREINSLQEKLTDLHEKFKPRIGDAATNGELGSIDSGLEAGQEAASGGTAKSPEQMMAELVLQEVVISELRSKLENAEEHLLQINGTLQKERDRRRELESYYLTQIKNRGGKSKGLIVRAFDALTGGSVDPATGGGQDEWSQMEESSQLFMTQPYGSFAGGGHPLYSAYHAGVPHHRNSTASLSLLIDESSAAYSHQIYGGGAFSDLPEGGPLSGADGGPGGPGGSSGGLGNALACSDTLLGTVGRLLRRQKNAFIFGSRKEKVISITLLIYLILVHFYAFEYYLG